MSSEQDIETRLERWLQREARPMPPRVLDAVRDRVPQVRQVSGPGLTVPGRWHRSYGRFALATAAAVLVVVAGPAALDQLRSVMRWSDGLGPGFGAPSPTASANPTMSASPEPPASPQPSPLPLLSASPPPAASLPTEATTSRDPFSGVWSTTDVDGSATTLTFGGSGPTRTVVVDDQRATACVGAHHVSDAVGTIDGSNIHIVGLGGCAGRPKDQRLDATWSYDPAAGTLASPGDQANGGGPLIWIRGPVKPDAFSGRWVATGIDGSSMLLSFDGAGLKRTVSYIDAGAATCKPGTSFLAQGSGTIGSVPGDGRFITIDLTGSCADGSSPTTAREKYRYDYGTNTLVGPLQPLDIGGNPLPQTVTWHRG